MEDQIGIKTTGIKTTGIKTTEDLQTTENSKTGITTLARKRKEDHQINNHLNVRITVLPRSKIHPELRKNKSQLPVLELALKLLLRLALVHAPLIYLQFALMDAQTLN